MIKKTILRNFTPCAIKLMLLALLWNTIVYYGGRILTANAIHADISSAFDKNFPLLPWTVAIYFLAYVFWAFNYCLIGSRGGEACYRFFLADYLARGICFAIFLLYPTTMERPIVPEGGVFTSLIKFLYLIDQPDMLFPSFHCLNSVMAVLALRGDKRVPPWYHYLSIVMAGAICFSTLGTRQHVLADVIAGIGVGILCYAMAGQKSIFPRYYTFSKQVQRS